MEISWPRPVSADACARVLKLALGENWSDLVTHPAGVQGADQKAATAEEEVASPTASGSCSGTLASTAETVEEPKFEAATLASRSRPHLFSLKLEVITALYKTKGNHDRVAYEDLQQVYTVNWEAELGHGSYGKVYIGTNGSATDTADKDTADKDTAGKVCTSFAIKMLRDKIIEQKRTRWDAIWAAEEEVRRHAALGLHPNIIKLVDVDLFWEPQKGTRCNSRSAHIGLVQAMSEHVTAHWHRA